MAFVKIKEIDLGMDEIVRNFIALNGSVLTAGIHDDTGDYPDGISIAEVGFFHEFGTKNMPARPFMRTAVITGADAINRRLRVGMKLIAENKQSSDVMLANVGRKLKEEIQRSIEAARAWAVPLKQSTIMRKLRAGSKKISPLRETDRMLKSGIDWKLDGA